MIPKSRKLASKSSLARLREWIWPASSSLLDARQVQVGVAIALILALVFGSITLGLRVPPKGNPRSLIPSALDYSRQVTEALRPLRDFFIERILGRTLPEPAPASAPGRSRSSLVPGRIEKEKRNLLVSHLLTNDRFSEAYAIPSVPFTARSNTAGAQREGNEPDGCGPVGGTVWYRFVAAGAVGLVADTSGSDHPVALGVYVGSDLDSLQQIGCATGPRGNARVMVAASASTPYYFQVSSLSAGNLVFSLKFQGQTMRFPIKEEDVYGPLGFPSPDGRYITFSVGTPVAGQPSETCVGGVAFVPATPGYLCRLQNYIYDRVTEKVAMVSISSEGKRGDDSTLFSTVSANGRHVLFFSWSTNLVEGDTNTCRMWQVPGQCPDVFVHDRDADGDGVFDETHPLARKTVRVSVASDGTQGNHHVGPGAISPDGRYVVFQSWASNLVPGDTNGVGDVLMHDRDADADGIFDETHTGARRTWRVSVSSTGEQTGGDLSRAADHESVTGRRNHVPFEVGNHFLGASANLRYVMFRSPGTNLDPRCNSGAYHVFVHDVLAKTTTCVSLDSRGRQADRGSRLHNHFASKVSDDGSIAIFNSDATNLVPGDTNGEEDLFVRDLKLGITERVTVASDGTQAAGEGPSAGRDLIFGLLFTAAAIPAFEDIYTLSELNHSLTPDGRFVFFSSGATNLTPGDQNEARDIFGRDLRYGVTTLLSVSTSGEQADLSSNIPVATSDGKMVAFYSLARNLDERQRGPDPGLFLKMYLRILPDGP